MRELDRRTDAAFCYPDIAGRSPRDVVRVCRWESYEFRPPVGTCSLRGDPMFKMALDLAPSDHALCSQPTISRLENLPGPRALLRMGRTMVDLYCESFRQVPRRIVLDIDDKFDAVHACEAAPVQAPARSHIVDGGLPTEALTAHVLVAKYADHLPLYRQAQIYARQGVHLDRSTLPDWVGRAAWWLTPLRDHLLSQLKSSPKLFADETTSPVLFIIIRLHSGICSGMGQSGIGRHARKRVFPSQHPEKRVPAVKPLDAYLRHNGTGSMFVFPRYAKVCFAVLAASPLVGLAFADTVSIASFSAALTDPLTLFAGRSPGIRGSDALFNTKPDRVASQPQRVRTASRITPEERVLPLVRMRPDEMPLGELSDSVLQPLGSLVGPLSGSSGGRSNPGVLAGGPSVGGGGGSDYSDTGPG